MFKTLRGLHLLKEKKFQDSSIKAHIENWDVNFDTDISTFINSALFRSQRRIILDRIFIDHPITPRLLMDPKAVADAAWCSVYTLKDDIASDAYDPLLLPPSLEEWLSVVSSMLNGKAPDPSMITYEMLKHLGPVANSLLLILIRKVRIGIDQGEVISPLLWVIYIDPLLTVLKYEIVDPYILQFVSLSPFAVITIPDLKISNLVFMDNSTLISSTKSGIEYMLSITEEFYTLNNTSVNHQKYTLISNSLPLTTTSSLSLVDFNLTLSSLNTISTLQITPISITSSFRFLGHALYVNLTDITLPGHTPLANTTIPDSNDQLQDRYVCSPLITSTVTLSPGVSTSRTNRKWIVTLDDVDVPLFGKQLSVQLAKNTCVIVYWISDCLSFPSDLICLRPCLSCDAHTPFSTASTHPSDSTRCTFKVSLLQSLVLSTINERICQNTTKIISSHSWADLSNFVTSYFHRLDLSPDFSLSSSTVNRPFAAVSFTTRLSHLPTPVVLAPHSHYCYYTDGSLINLSTAEVSMGWSWVQVIHDAGYLNSVAIYACGSIRDWPSFSRAEAAAIFATLAVTPADSTVSIYTDSQTTIDGLRLCASFSYTNSRLYYKTSNFELWASIERCIYGNQFTVLPIKVKGHNGNYWNEFADSLANTAHLSDDVTSLHIDDYTSSHDIRLVYDDIVCESNP
ncbi:ribonuclease H-like domain-containing protein [Rhizophagus clarus]|uniref:Ribonuclease H-like domain-containing protein n=1 Tax=Rhizophagus clarus TaxID=94130 RepID=A0A8H3MFC8_9GLOM|nr:ribonuclease H-like domain-containing protein [Rhizophagus clarus]